MHDKPITADQLCALADSQFEAVFGPSTAPATEEERTEYARYLRDSGSAGAFLGTRLSFADWRGARAARGNREGQNHD